MNPSIPRVSVNLIAKNEEALIADCLASVQWADEIIVCDDGSTDRTVEICHQFPKVQVHLHPLAGEGPKRNFVLSQSTGEWILVIDADERIPPELRDEILARLGNEPANGYFVRMRYPAFGRWIVDSRPMNPRLFRREAGRFPGRLVHTHATVTGPMGVMTHPFVHLSATYTTIRGYLEKQNIYSTHAATDLYLAGRRISPLNLPWHMLVKPLLAAIRKYSLWGIRFGTPGFLLSALTGFDYFAIYAKLWELQRSRQSISAEQPSTVRHPEQREL